MTTAKGGRPRALTLAEIRQQQPPEAQNNEKEVVDSLATNSLAELKRLYLHHRSNGNQTHAGLGVTPSLLAPKGVRKIES